TALATLVLPWASHSLMWWISQNMAGVVQPGAWHPRSLARMARRWVTVKNRLVRFWFSTVSGPFQVWATSSLSQHRISASAGCIGPWLMASDRNGAHGSRLTKPPRPSSTGSPSSPDRPGSGQSDVSGLGRLITGGVIPSGPGGRWASGGNGGTPSARYAVWRSWTITSCADAP